MNLQASQCTPDGCTFLHMVKRASIPFSPAVLSALVDVIRVDVLEIEMSIVTHVRLWLPSLHQRVVLDASWLRVEGSLQIENLICCDISFNWIIDAQYPCCHLWERGFWFRYLLALSNTLASGYTNICFKISARQYFSITSDISRFYAH